jgi:hypothetical protein
MSPQGISCGTAAFALARALDVGRLAGRLTPEIGAAEPLAPSRPAAPPTSGATRPSGDRLTLSESARELLARGEPTDPEDVDGSGTVRGPRPGASDPRVSGYGATPAADGEIASTLDLFA